MDAHFHSKDRIAVVTSDPCRVQTSIGAVEGFVDPAFPHVRQWLGLPFAEPPIGERRFEPPERKGPLPAGEVLSATKMPPSPMQSRTYKADIYAKYVPEYMADSPYSEDCLYLNVYAPIKAATAETAAGEVDIEEPLPTVVFFYGGEGEWGGTNAEYNCPLEWVERSRRHITVLFNSRLGVFGYPNAKGLECGPLGVLDQRCALEFLRDNIRAFGGSPDRITAFGTAIGSGTIETHLFAWPDDPIISSAICMSFFLPIGGTNRDFERKSFSILARRLGCPEDASPAEEVAFMRTIDAGAIAGCFRAYNDSPAEFKMSFRPPVDGKVMFSIEEVLKRAYNGQFARNIPVIVGMTAEDGNALVPCAGMAQGKQSSRDAADQWTRLIESGMLQTIGYRLANNCTTYRCLYDGDFPNVSPRPWMKAYHFAEVPMIMGTHEIERGPSSKFQRQLSAAMQDMWVDFARDPTNGLARWGWDAVSHDKPSNMVFGRDGALYKLDNSLAEKKED